MFPIHVPSSFRIIAHRGASAYAPENTIPAFALAKKMGATDVEIDVQLTTDGVVVVCHDETLERYGHGGGVIEKLSSEVLLDLDMGSWFSPYLFNGTPMITLAQLLAEFGDTFVYHIELKGKAIELAEAVYAIVRQKDLVECSIFTSFSIDQLVRMRMVCADCRLGYLVGSFDDDVYRFACELDLFQLCPRAEVVTDSLVEKGHSLVEEIRVWGVYGKPEEVRTLVQKVVKSGCNGMTINWPDWVTH